MCQACGFGEQCVTGRCVMAACGPMTCSGCCAQGLCVTPTQQTRFACGTNGGMCTQCPMGQACTNGTCATPVCDATTCPTGCCQNGMCNPGTSRFACGGRGQTCVRCGMNQGCNNGLCSGMTPTDGGIPPMDGGIITTDAGTNVPAGSACAGNTACQPPAAAFCIAEVVLGQPTGYSGGYCTQSCGANSPCTTGACITETGTAQSACRSTCSAPGTQSTCRTGYVCSPSSLSSVPGYCRPRCDSMGVLASCAMGQTCNTTTGLCN
jgi:hypothetical protein